jgi:hypothetical protein
MGFSAVHRPHAIAFPSSTYVTQFTDARPNNNYEEFVERSAADTAPYWTGVIGAAPELAFTSRQLKTILDLCTLDDVAIGYAPSGGTVSVYYRKGKNRGLREAVASEVHDRFDMANNACLFWNSIGASQRQLAELDCMLKAVSSDGSTAPMVHVGSCALAGDSVVNHVYTLGPVSVNGAWVDSVASARLNNGFTFDEFDESGNAFQQYFGIDEHNPRVTIETDDLSVFDDYGESGVALTSLKLYFRKLNKGSVGPVADGTAVHIGITATSGTILVQEGSGIKARHRVTIALGRPDASTQPFVVNTATAITV